MLMVSDIRYLHNFYIISKPRFILVMYDFSNQSPIGILLDNGKSIPLSDYHRIKSLSFDYMHTPTITPTTTMYQTNNLELYRVNRYKREYVTFSLRMLNSWVCELLNYNKNRETRSLIDDTLGPTDLIISSDGAHGNVRRYKKTFFLIFLIFILLF